MKHGTSERHTETTSGIATKDGRKLTYQIHGPEPGDGIFPMFFMHGNPGCRLGPFPPYSTLSTLNISIIAPDRPGYGQSDRKPGRFIADTADDIAALADALNVDRFGIMGRSGGVPHALACAALLGDRIHNVSGLSGIAPPDDNFDRFEGMVPANAAIHRIAQQDSQALERKYRDLADMVANHPSAFLQDFLWDQLGTEDKKLFYLQPELANLYANIYYESLVPQQGTGWVDDTLALNKEWGFTLQDIQQPTLLWHGEYDIFSAMYNSVMMAEKIREGGNSAVRTITAPSHGHFDSLRALQQILAYQRDKARGLR